MKLQSTTTGISQHRNGEEDGQHRPRLSVILCTYNNAASLELTLAQLRACDIPASSDVELIVVNNNSSDETAKVLARLPAWPHKLIVVTETRQGLSHARNCGLRKASGEYILFTDDDAEIPSTWISSYLELISETKADCIFSKILTIWDKPQPWWYDSRFEGYFAHIDYGDEQKVVDDPRYEFYGKNFCVRRTTLTELGGFDPELGRRGGKLLAGEESVIFEKLLTEGKQIIYTPIAPVGHRLKDREYEAANISKQVLDMAESTYFMATLSNRAKLMGRPIFIARQSLKLLPRFARKWISSTVRFHKRDAFYYKLKSIATAKLLLLWIAGR